MKKQNWQRKFPVAEPAKVFALCISDVHDEPAK